MAKAAIIRLADYRKNTQAETNLRDKLDADKLAKDSVEVEKKSLTATEVLNKNLEELVKVFKQNKFDKRVTDKAQQTKFYGGAGGAIKERVESIKEFFTLRGFLDKTGIVEKGSKGFIGGIVDKGLERREAKQQYIKDMMKTDPSVRLMGKDKAKEMFGKRFDKSQTAGLNVQENQQELNRLKEAGLTPEQIQRSPEYKKKTELAATLSKVDPRFRGSDTVGGGSLKESAAKLRGSNVVPLKKDDIKEVEGNLSEEEIENLRMMEEQNEVLKQIEENTRPDGKKKEEEKPKEEGDGIFGSIFKFLKGWGKRLGMKLLSGLMSLGSMIGNGLLTAAKFLLNPAVLGKLITRVFPIAMIVGSLVNGIWDGIKTFMETGSIGEAIIAGLGGILEFLSFGLIDATTLKNMWESFTGFVDEYITKPIGNFFKNIKDAVAGFFENIGIPEISFSVFGKKIAFGPWYPFKKDDAPEAPEAPTEGNQPARIEGADKDKKPGLARNADGSVNLDKTSREGGLTRGSEFSNQQAARAEKLAQFEPDPNKKKRLLAEAEHHKKQAAQYDQELKGMGGKEVKEQPKPVAKEKPLSQKQQDDLAEAARNGRLGLKAQHDQMLKDSAVQKPTAANQVYNKSAENQARKEQKPPPAPVVVAPQTNVNNSSQTMPVVYSPRNNEPTVNDYVRRRAVG